MLSAISASIRRNGYRRMMVIGKWSPSSAVFPPMVWRLSMDHGVCSASVIINILSRSRDPAPPITLQTPDALRLTHVPVADKVVDFQ